MKLNWELHFKDGSSRQFDDCIANFKGTANHIRSEGVKHYFAVEPMYITTVLENDDGVDVEVVFDGTNYGLLRSGESCNISVGLEKKKFEYFRRRTFSDSAYNAYKLFIDGRVVEWRQRHSHQQC